MRAALFSYVRERDVLRCRVASWRILYPNSGVLEGRRAANGCDVFG
jgi:hypothetical protein